MKLKNNQSIPLHYTIVEVIKYLFVGLQGILLVLEMVNSLSWRLEGDNAFIHYVAYLINEHNFVPYKDIFEVNMPGTYLFHMAIGKLFGYSDFAFQLVNIIWLTATSIVTWFILKPFGKIVAFAGVFLFGLNYLEYGPTMVLQRDVMVILPISIAILLAIRHSSWLGMNLKFFLIGILFGCVALIKPPLIIGLPAIILYNCIQDDWKSVKQLLNPFIKRVIFVLLGFLPVIITAFGWVWSIGALPSFWDILTSYTPLYTQMSGNFEFKGIFRQITYHIYEYLLFGGLSTFLVMSFFGMYMIFKTSSSSSNRKLAVLLLSQIILYSLYVAINGKFWTYYWMPFMYFMSLGAATILFSPVSSARPTQPFSILPVIAFILATLPLTVIPAYHYVQGNVPTVTDSRADEIAAYLNEHLSPTDKVQPLDWGGSSLMAMLRSKSILATPYIVDFQFYHHVSNPYIQHLRKDFLAELSEEMPTFMIDVDADPEMKGSDVSYEFPELTKFIQQHYTVDYKGKDFEIFRRRSEIIRQ